MGVFAPLVGAPVFKTGGGFEQSSLWVRFPYTPVNVTLTACAGQGRKKRTEKEDPRRRLLGSLVGKVVGKGTFSAPTGPLQFLDDILQGVLDAGVKLHRHLHGAVPQQTVQDRGVVLAEVAELLANNCDPAGLPDRKAS